MIAARIHAAVAPGGLGLGARAEATLHVATFPEFVTEQFKSPLSTAETWAWLLRAAEAGSVQAQYDVGAILATGGDWGNGAVVPVDLKAAVGWYRRAAEAGLPRRSSVSPLC